MDENDRDTRSDWDGIERRSERIKAARGSKLLSGGWVGPYRIDRLLGEGGMGSVYLAHQETPIRRTVALKLLKRVVSSEKALQRFRREQETQACISHPSVAKIYDAGITSDGIAYFSMEYVDGHPIHTYCDNHQLGIRDRILVFLDVCRGVMDAHQKGIIHQDIKPSNILVRDIQGKPQPVIIDFGVARLLPDGSNPSVNTSNTWVGTPDYMSPEQAQGAAVDVRSDIYSLCILLYELLTGRSPHKPNNSSGFYQIVGEVVSGKTVRPSNLFERGFDGNRDLAAQRGEKTGHLRRVLRGDLDWITLKGLEKDPRRRYQSIAQLIEDLEAYLEDRPISISGPSLFHRTLKFCRRHWVAVTVGTTFVTALLIGLAGTYIGLQRAKEAQRLAVAEAETSDEMGRFLVDLFKYADPNYSGSQQVSARELLDLGAEKIRRDLAGKPLTQTKVMRVMGQAFFNLSDYQRAADVLEDALSLQRELLGDEHDETMATASLLGRVLATKAEFERAESLLVEARRFREDQGETRGAAYVDVLNGLGMLYYEMGRYPEGLQAYREALSLQEAYLPGDSADMAASLNGVGISAGRLERNDEAVVFLERALEMRRRLFQGDHPEIAQALGNLAAIYDNGGRDQAAEEMYLQAASMWETLLGPLTRQRAVCLVNLGALYEESGRYHESERVLAEALAGFENTVGKEHPFVAYVCNYLGKVYAATERFKTAEEHFRRSIMIADATMGRDNAGTQSYYRDYAAFLRGRGREDEASALEAGLFSR